MTCCYSILRCGLLCAASKPVVRYVNAGNEWIRLDPIASSEPGPGHRSESLAIQWHAAVAVPQF